MKKLLSVMEVTTELIADKSFKRFPIEDCQRYHR